MLFAYEQARSYLFSKPLCYLSAESGGLIIRNFGPGPMLGLYGTVRVLAAEGVASVTEFSWAGLVVGESLLLLPHSVLTTRPVTLVKVDLTYKRLNGRHRRWMQQLPAEDLLEDKST